jgi:hypothetical protein
VRYCLQFWRPALRGSYFWAPRAVLFALFGAQGSNPASANSTARDKYEKEAHPVRYFLQFGPSHGPYSGRPVRTVAPIFWAAVCGTFLSRIRTSLQTVPHLTSMRKETHPVRYCLQSQQGTREKSEAQDFEPGLCKQYRTRQVQERGLRGPVRYFLQFGRLPPTAHIPGRPPCGTVCSFLTGRFTTVLTVLGCGGSTNSTARDMCGPVRYYSHISKYGNKKISTEQSRTLSSFLGG